MEGYRSEKIAQLIREQLGLLLIRRVKDPAVQGVTITDVRVSGDLSVATAYFVASDEEVKRVARGLDRASSFLRRELGARLELRRTPALRFRRDEAVEHGERIDEVLRELEPEELGDSGDER